MPGSSLFLLAVPSIQNGLGRFSCHPLHQIQCVKVKLTFVPSAQSDKAKLIRSDADRGPEQGGRFEAKSFARNQSGLAFKVDDDASAGICQGDLEETFSICDLFLLLRG